MGCKKASLSLVKPYQLSYGDSVFYINGQNNNFLASPLNAKPGNFTAFPSGLVIDPTTGTINVSQSEAGRGAKSERRKSPQL